METKQRHFNDTRQHYFLFGPRGTGKSTWLRERYQNGIWLDLLQPEQYRRYEARPERLFEMLPPQSHSATVVVDEIQMVPGLLSAIHSAIETHPQLQFVLTGSSARKLKSTGVDLLGGRAATRQMHPFMASELGSDFELKRALELGMLPVVLGAAVPADALGGYIDVYLRQEVQAEAMVRRIDSFTRFLEVISFSQASVLNLSEVSRECEVKRATATGYAEILEDLLIATTLPVFSRRAKRQLVSSRKFYFFDCGVFRSLRPKGPLDRPSEIDGAALETLVFQHLRAWSDYSSGKSNLYYWRTRSGVEVDFIVYGENGLYAIEVKNAASIRLDDLRSLTSFCEDYPEATPILLYRGKETLHIKNIPCVPIEPFLQSLTPDKPFPSGYATE